MYLFSADEGFIEVTVDPDKAQADDLFPADIFHSVNSDEKNYMFNIENQASILSEEQEKEDPTNDDQEVMSHDNPDLHEMMSQESSEHSESEEVVTQNTADKFDEDAQYTDLVDQFRNFTEVCYLMYKFKASINFNFELHFIFSTGM